MISDSDSTSKITPEMIFRYRATNTNPLFADLHNDSSIFTSLMKADASALREWVDRRTVMVVERGFRDALALLKELGLILKMPHQCLQNVGFFGPHHVPIWEEQMQTWRVSVSALLHAAVTSFV